LGLAKNDLPNFQRGLTLTASEDRSFAEGVIMHSSQSVSRLHKAAALSAGHHLSSYTLSFQTSACFQLMFFTDAADLLYTHPRDRLTPALTTPSTNRPNNAPLMDVEAMGAFQEQSGLEKFMNMVWPLGRTFA
jgi:hypothetical protein